MEVGRRAMKLRRTPDSATLIHAPLKHPDTPTFRGCEEGKEENAEQVARRDDGGTCGACGWRFTPTFIFGGKCFIELQHIFRQYLNYVPYGLLLYM